MFGPKPKTLFEKIVAGLRISDGCWPWAGALDKNGYGVVNISLPNRKGKRIFAHRLVFEMVKGKIPDGLEPDHTCRNRRCVRPDHVEPVTHAENMRRAGLFNRWDFCSKGHPLSGDNLAPTSNGRGRCRICKQESYK